MRCPNCGYEFSRSTTSTQTLMKALEVNIAQGPAPSSILYRITRGGTITSRLEANEALVSFKEGSRTRYFIVTPIGLRRLVARGLVPPEKEQEYERILRRLIEEWVPT
jgi:hypothetical protein